MSFSQYNTKFLRLHGRTGKKLILRILGRPDQPIQFWVFLLPVPTLTKGLLTFAGPQNAQSNDFFMYTKTWSDLKIFDQI